MADQGSRLQNLEFLPDNLNLALLDFQRHGVRFGINNKGRCLIGDEMGLGKTLQAISIAYFYKDEWPLLIVVPSSMKYPWIEEIEKWITDLEPGDINLIRSGTDISNIPTSKISILGYGLCGDRRSSKLLVNAMKKQEFKVVILDESHYLKNRNAGRTKLLHPIAKNSKRVILLTGTPSLARPEELYIQLDIVRPGVFGTFSAFANRYCEAHYEDVGKFRKWNTRGACRLDELHSRLGNGMMIRRLKKNVLKQLPPKRRQKITFDVPESEHKKELFQFKAEFKNHHRTIENKQSSPQKKSDAVFQLNRLSTVLYHYTGLAKAGSIQHYIADLLDGMENKFIVFCRHKQVIMAVIQQLSKKHVKYIHIDGSVPSSVRGSLVNKFQNDPSVRVAVLAIEAASFGLTLTAADHVVFAELHYTPGVMMQAEDRAHRIGQVNAVNVHYLVGRGTLDEVLWGMLRKKIYVTSSALDGKLDELHADEGDEEKSKQLSACAAWLREESEDNEEDLQGYLFSQKPKKSRNRIEGQKDVRTYFTPPTSTSKPAEISLVDSDEEMKDVPSPDNTKTDCKENKENTTISIEDSTGDENEYDEDELASMLVEGNDSPNESDSSSSKTPKAQDISSRLTNDRDSNERKKVKGITQKNSTGKDLNTRYEDSEMVDSEDIFQSYIENNSYDDDDDDEDDEDDDDDDDVEAQSCQSVSSPSSSNQKCSSCPEKSETIEDRITALNCEEIHGNSTTSRSELKDEELDKTKAESLERSRKRNPFSLKNKGMVDKTFSFKMNESDSDDDFVTPTPPMSSADRKNEPVGSTSSQENKDTSLSSSSTTSTQKNKETSLSSSSTSNTQDNKDTSLGTLSTSNTQDNKDTSRGTLSTKSSVNTKQNVPKRKKKSKAQTRTVNTGAAPWSCRACTFINDPQMIECSMCFTAKKPEKTVLNGEESITTSADFTENGQKVITTQADDKTSDYFSGSPTNTEASEDNQPSTSSVLCKDDSSSMDLYKQSSELIREKNERNEVKTNRSSVSQSTPPTDLCDDEDFDDFTRKSFLKWSCSACTFLNDAMLNECCICMTPRRRSQRKTKSRWSTWSWEKRRRERHEKSSKKSSRQKTDEDHEIKMEISEEERNEIGTNIDGKLLDAQEAAPESTAKSRQRSRSRKKLNMGDKVERAFLDAEKSLCVEKGQLFAIPEDADLAGKVETHFKQNDVKEGEQVSIGTRENSEEEHEKSEEDPFVLQFSDSDSTDDDRGTLSITSTIHGSREGEDISNVTQEQALMRLEEIIDDSDESILDGKEASSCGNGSSNRPREESKSTHMAAGGAGENHEDSHVVKQRSSCENDLPHPQEDCKLTQMVGQQTTRKEEERQGDEDSHDGRERTSCENDLPRPQEDCKLTQMVGQQPTRKEEERQGDEDSHDGRERTSCENDPSKPREDSKLTNNAEEQTPRGHENIDVDDEYIHDERKSSSQYNNTGKTNSPHENTSVNNAEQRLSEKVIREEDGYKMEQQRNERERVNNESQKDNSSSNTKKNDVEESLQELQEAAEQIFGSEDDFDDLSMGNDFTIDSNEAKFDDVVVRKPKDPPAPITLHFSLSVYTDRVYLYDEEDQFLQSSFTMSDVKNNNKEDLPHILQHEYNYKQAKRMLKEWDRLGVQQKRILSKSKLVFMNPFEAYRMARALKSEESSTNVRHPSKELRLQKVINAALEVGGQVRLVTRSPATKKRKRPPTENEGSTSNVRNPDEETTSSSSKEFSCVQAFGPDGVPLCLFCKAPADYGTMGNDWDSRFCSHDCKENYQIRISGTAIRRTLFEAERGVCQLCHFDAHACFQGVKSLPKKERRAFLEKSIYSDLPSQLLNRMIVDPKEGMFWEADHIVAVVEGGGECGMENFRTLCVPCHKKVTRELLQRHRRKRQRLDVTESQKISTFLKSKS